MNRQTRPQLETASPFSLYAPGPTRQGLSFLPNRLRLCHPSEQSSAWQPPPRAHVALPRTPLPRELLNHLRPTSSFPQTTSPFPSATPTRARRTRPPSPRCAAAQRCLRDLPDVQVHSSPERHRHRRIPAPPSVFLRPGARTAFAACRRRVPLPPPVILRPDHLEHRPPPQFSVSTASPPTRSLAGPSSREREQCTTFGDPDQSLGDRECEDLSLPRSTVT